MTSEDFTVYFYSRSFIANGRIKCYDDYSIDYYNFFLRNTSGNITSLFGGNDVKVFTSSNGIDFTYFYSLNNGNNLKSLYIDYFEEPLIYSSVDMPFYIFVDDINTGYIPFIISTFDIVNSSDVVVSSSDVLSQNKDINSIWTMIYNVFNPPSDSNNFNSIEEQHSAVLSKADNASFFSLFEGSRNLISGILSVTWLITASNLLFNYFSSFLILCCVFLTISRVMR